MSMIERLRSGCTQALSPSTSEISLNHKALSRSIMKSIRALRVFGVLAIGGMALTSPEAMAQSWNQAGAHNKGCSNNTRVWHARCEHSNGWWSHDCRDSSFSQFKGHTVDRQSRLKDRAWTEIRTQDASCGWNSPSVWADGSAHNKGCSGHTRIWHVRCENNAGWKTDCAERTQTTFKDTSVYGQTQMSDKAWTEVATKDATCGWSDAFDDEKALMSRSLVTLDLAFAISDKKYDDVMPEEDGGDKGVVRYQNPSLILSGDDVPSITTAESDIQMHKITPGNTLNNVSALTVYRRHSRHLMNFAILSDQDTVFVSFWGTVFGENHNVNVRVLLVRNPAYKYAETHPGYAAVAYDVWDDVKAEIKAQGGDTKRVVMTGHSMGGGIVGHLMFLAMQDEVLDKDKSHRLITFGTPRYGTKTLRREFDQMISGGYVNTKAYDVEISEDGHRTNAFAGIIEGRMGTRITLPLYVIKPDFTNAHAHENYFRVVGAL